MCSRQSRGLFTAPYVASVTNLSNLILEKALTLATTTLTHEVGSSVYNKAKL